MDYLPDKELLRSYRESVQLADRNKRIELEKEVLNRMKKCQHETVIYMGKLNKGRQLFFCEGCNEYVRG